MSSVCFALGESCVCLCFVFFGFYFVFLRAERLDGGFGVRFRVLALVFVFVRCSGEFCLCVLVLWGFWLKEETPGTTPLLSAPRKGRGLGQASKMTGSRCSELSDPVAAAAYSARSRPTRNKRAFPRGRPPPSHNPAGRAAPVPGSEFTETPPPPPPRGTQTQPPFPCAPCQLWVDLPLRLASLLRTSLTPAALDRGADPRRGAGGEPLRTTRN